MGFSKGQSGNVYGRPRMTEEQKRQKEEFKALLSASTVIALQSILEIMKDKHHKDRLAAAKFVLDKSYGTNAVFLADGTKEDDSVVIRVVPYGKKCNKDEFEEDWEDEE